MRRICALLLTAAFGLGVVGCGEGAPPPKKPTETTKPVPKPTDTKPTDTKPVDEKKPDAK
jgi:hypothetical protein